MNFSPGELTGQEAKVLTERIRKLEQMVKIRVVPPLFMVGGMQQPVIRMDPIEGGGETWRAGKVTARSPGPPISYTVQPLKIDSSGAYVNDGATVTPCYRMPTKDYDETVLVEIPVDEGVLWREDPEQAGKYQLTPWGGLKKTTVEHIYRVCGQCVDVAGVKKFRVRMAIRKLSEYGRDRRVIWQPPATGETGIDDNTDGTTIPGS